MKRPERSPRGLRWPKQALSWLRRARKQRHRYDWAPGVQVGAQDGPKILGSCPAARKAAVAGL